MDLHCPDKVRATGPSTKRDALDGEMRLSGEDVGEESFDFDGRGVSIDSDMITATAAVVTPDCCFERFGGSRQREDLLDFGQNAAPIRCENGLAGRATKYRYLGT